MRKSTIAEVGIIIILAIALIGSIISAKTVEIFIETQYVFTVVNGIATCTGIIVTFTATLIVLGITKEIFNIRKDNLRLIFTFLGIFTSLSFVGASFLILIGGHYIEALRGSMMGLYISIFLLTYVLLLIGIKSEPS